MPRSPDERVSRAKELFDQGMKLVEIAKTLSVSEGTVRSWKSRYKWGNATLQKKKRNVAKHRGGQPGNKNAVGHGAPEHNKNAEKYGFFSKYLPEETKEIFDAINHADPLDLLWHQIQIAYAAIVRAQNIMYVRDKEDVTKEHIGESEKGDSYNFQQSWDKQANFLQAQARAQSELRGLIKQYDEMLHKNWDLATEEQKARIAHMKARTDKLTGNNAEIEDLDEIESDIYGAD